MKSTHIKIGDSVYLDTFSSELIFEKSEGTKRVRIEPLVARLLATIAVNKGSLVTREELVEEVWEGNEGVGNKALTRNIYKIRKVFEKQGLQNPIETLPKKGYRLRSMKKGVVIRSQFKKRWAIAAAIALALVALKVDVPGMIHNLAQSLGH